MGKQKLGQTYSKYFLAEMDHSEKISSLQPNSLLQNYFAQ